MKKIIFILIIILSINSISFAQEMEGGSLHRKRSDIVAEMHKDKAYQRLDSLCEPNKEFWKFGSQGWLCFYFDDNDICTTTLVIVPPFYLHKSLFNIYNEENIKQLKNAEWECVDSKGNKYSLILKYDRSNNTYQLEQKQKTFRKK